MSDNSNSNQNESLDLIDFNLLKLQYQTTKFSIHSNGRQNTKISSWLEFAVLTASSNYTKSITSTCGHKTIKSKVKRHHKHFAKNCCWITISLGNKRWIYIQHFFLSRKKREREKEACVQLITDKAISSNSGCKGTIKQNSDLNYFPKKCPIREAKTSQLFHQYCLQSHLHIWTKWLGFMLALE